MVKSIKTDIKSMGMAINHLKGKNYLKAEEYIRQIMLTDPHSPVAHNLYGILEELMMEEQLARKHYRAAYALDPAYKPAIHNLERISTLNLYATGKPIDYGDRPEEEPEIQYAIEYDDRHVGHLVKMEKE